MKKSPHLLLGSVTLAVAAVLLSAGLTARAAVVSVNFRQFTGSGSITNGYGVVPADNWTNWTSGVSDPGSMASAVTLTSLADSSGNASSVNVTFKGNQVRSFNTPILGGTPMASGLIAYDANDPTNGTYLSLSGLNSTFVGAYDVIVYLGGFNVAANGNIGAITDGTQTNYYRVPNPFTTNLVLSTATVNGGLATTQATYVRFSGRTSDTLYISLDVPTGGGSAGIGGFQIVGLTASDLLTRTWKGNLNTDWDTSTLNWTNAAVGVATNYTDGNLVVFNDEAVAASPTVNLTAPRSPGNVTVNSTKNYTFTGSGIAGAVGLTKKGAGSLTLANSNTYSNNTVISAGALKLGASGVIPDGAGFGSVSVATGGTFDLNGNSEDINGLSGSGILDNTGGAATLSLGLADTGGTFPGTIQGAVSLTKLGTNVFTLTGTSSHTGTTTAGQGTLRLIPSSIFSGSSALVVSNGATLALSVSNSSGLATAGNVNLNGGVALNLEYGNAAVTGSTTPLTTSGALNLTGTSQISISGFGFTVGTYTLISFGSQTGGGSISSVPASVPTGMSANISQVGNTYVLNVTAPSIQSLSYTFGDGGIWATNAGATYWNLGTANYTEYPGGFGDSVEFGTNYNGTPLTGGTVSVDTDVHPYSVAAVGSYTLTGSGRITGATGITRSGSTGTFVLDNTNTYTGVTLISAGSLQINRPGALGSTSGGTVVETGASLALTNGITLAGEPLTLNGQGISQNGALRTVGTNSPVTVSAPITLGSTGVRIRTADRGELILAGPITDNGSNYSVFLHAAGTNAILRLNSSDNVASNFTVYGVSQSQGRIIFGVTNVFPNSSLTVGGGVFDLNGNNQDFAGLRDGFAPNQGILTNSSASPVTLTLNYSDTNSTASFLSVLGGAVNVVKQGIGVQSFGGGTNIVHTYSGTTTINGGVFGVSSDFSRVTNSFTVNTGGTLRGSSSNVIGGSVTVNPGGTFYAGFASNQVGALIISNSLTLGGEMIVAIDKDLSQSNDVVIVSGALTYGGSLTVIDVNTNGTAVVVGDKFRVFKTGGTGSFTPPINFISMSNNTVATFSFSDGELTVTSVGAVSPPTLNYGPLGGGAFQFSWTEPGFKLQWQTNAASAGLKTNWADYPGGGTSPVSVTNNPAIPATFFRLSQ